MSKTPFRKGRGFRQTGACVASDIRKVTEKRGFAETRLLTDWEEICGADLAAVATPVKVSYAQKGIGATLVVHCASARAPEVSMQRETIRERVNACYGYNAIQRVQITQTGAPTRPIGFHEEKSQFVPKKNTRVPSPEMKAALTPIGDEGLRKALMQLGENVLNRDTRSTRTKENG